MGRGSARIFNIISVVFLILTVITIVIVIGQLLAPAPPRGGFIAPTIAPTNFPVQETAPTLEPDVPAEPETAATSETTG